MSVSCESVLLYFVNEAVHSCRSHRSVGPHSSCPLGKTQTICVTWNYFGRKYILGPSSSSQTQNMFPEFLDRVLNTLDTSCGRRSAAFHIYYHICARPRQSHLLDHGVHRVRQLIFSRITGHHVPQSQAVFSQLEHTARPKHQHRLGERGIGLTKRKAFRHTLWFRMSFIRREASELWDSGKHFFGITPYFSESRTVQNKTILVSQTALTSLRLFPSVRGFTYVEEVQFITSLPNVLAIAQITCTRQFPHTQVNHSTWTSRECN